MDRDDLARVGNFGQARRDGILAALAAEHEIAHFRPGAAFKQHFERQQGLSTADQDNLIDRFRRLHRVQGIGDYRLAAKG